MSEIRTANLVIRTKQDKVAFEVIGRSSNFAVIDSRELPLLLEFLNTYLYSLSNRRTGFRINLSAFEQDISNRFYVHVKTNSGLVPVTPIDISMTGILVESSQDIGQTGSPVDVNLRFDDIAVELPSIIVRQKESNTHTAFRFAGICEEKGLHPPPELDSLFHSLETLWLEKSLDLEWFQKKSLGLCDESEGDF